MTSVWPMIHMGKIESISSLSPCDKAKVQSTFDSYKNVQQILDLADSFTTLPNTGIKEILSEAVKQAGNGVAETFFNQHSSAANWGDKDFTSHRNELAVALISSDLTKVSKYNFSHVTNGPQAKTILNQLANGPSGKAMGDHLLIEELKRTHGFQEYLSSKESWVKKLENILDDDVYVIGTILKQLSQEVNLPVKMKLFFLKALGSNKLDEIQKKWISLSSKEMIRPAINFVQKENLLSFAAGWLNSGPFQSSVNAACFKAQTKSWVTTIPSYSPTIPPTIIDHTETVYGDAVRGWLNSSNGPECFGMRTGIQPDNIKKHSHADNPVSCFLAGTTVMLSSFKSAKIEHLKEHDAIVGFGGNVGIVSSEKVAQTLKTATSIYGFNDEDPFFLASHPFWTQDGWRSVNPHLSKLENSWLDVGQLSEGDYVRKAKDFEDGKIIYEWIRVDEINHTSFPAGTNVYGVHTREGPRSYHANGYLVFENYPEITSKMVVDGMQNLSFGEKAKLQKHLTELEPILNRVLGPGPAKAMASLTQKYLTERLEKTKEDHSKKVSLKELSLPHINLQYQAGKTSLGSYSMPSKMSLVRGHLFLDDAHVPNASISDHNKVAWTRAVADGRWEHGAIKLHGSRHQGNGFVSLTQNQNDTKSQLSASFIAGAHVNKYKCYRSSAPEEKGSSTTVNWIDFGELSMGTDCSSGSCEPVGEILIPPNMDTLDDLGHHVIFSVDAKLQLSVSVVVPSAYQSFLGYAKLTGVFSMDFSSFSGTCVSYDATKPGFQGETYAWKGVIEKDITADKLLSFARNESLQSKIHAVHKQSSQTALSTTSFDTVDGPQIAPMAITMASLTDQQLSVDELFMITPPDAQSVHELTFSLLQEAMKYTMNSDNRENILGVVKPNLDGDMISVSNTYKDFFGNRFANAYLMKGLSDSAHFEGKITTEQKDQLLYYWAGSDKGCLSQDADYNKANNDVSRIAYIQSCPDVEKYLSSSEGGPYWAEKLYNKLIEPAILNGLALTAEISQTMTSVQKQSMILFCLAPDNDYGAKFYRKIMMTRLNESSSYFVGNKDDQEVMKEIVTDSIKQLIIKILSGGDATTKEITTELNKQLNDAATELNVEVTADAEETANDILGHMEDFISEVLVIFSSKSGTAWDKLTASTEQWLAENPIKAGIGKFFSVLICQGLWITSIVFTAKTFMQWNTLKPEQKVSLIADTVDITLQSIAQIPEMIEDFKSACYNGKVGFNFIKNWMKASSDPAEIEMPLLKSVEQIEKVDEAGVDVAMFESVSNSMEDIPELVTGWQKFFSVTEMFAKGTGLIAGAAGCVVVGFQIYRDFKTDAPVAQKALDICQGITMGVATLAAAVGVFVEAACIPIIGIVCAIIGIALAIASLFVHRDPPKPKPTKVDLYVSGTGSTFVNQLPKPSQKWLDDYHKKHPDSKEN